MSPHSPASQPEGRAPRLPNDKPIVPIGQIANRARTERVLPKDEQRLSSSQQSTRLSIAIIGSAAAGTSMLHELALAADDFRDAQVYILDRNQPPQGGPAHSTKCSSFRVNMRPNLHDFTSFISFLEACRLLGWNTKTLPLRWHLSAYLHTVFDFAVAKLELAGASIEIVAAEVTSVDRLDQRYLIKTNSGRAITADVVVLASGNQAPAIPPGLFAEDQGA